MNIYERLKDDHGKQRGLCGGLAKTSGDTEERRRLFTALKTEVEAYAAAEEQTLYAELIAATETQAQARHSIAEHKAAADLIEELEKTDMSSSGWIATFEKLRVELEHHFDEEESDVFPEARKLIAAGRADELGTAFARLKEEHAG
jgi:iron-sulfur cluster repair protein YtfE (RIC family)